MDGRRLAAERGLVGPAVAVLTSRALGGIPFESLGTVKALLKRFFSAQAWDEPAAEALAAAVGRGEGWWEEPLADDLVLEFGWRDGRFRLGVASPDPDPVGDGLRDADALAATFEADIVPEATPNLRTVAFRTGAISGADSREYHRGEAVDDRRVARLFTAFSDVARVMVGRDFLAVTVRHPDRWPDLLAPVLTVLAEELVGAGGEGPDAGAAPRPEPTEADDPNRPAEPAARRRSTERRLDRVWRELGGLRASQPGDLERLLAATAAPDAVTRQVGAKLMADAPADMARAVWARLVADPSRAVRRAAVDAVVDAGREELRDLLERALADADAWVRWKAVRGLAELGPGPSRHAIEALGDDPDFRVRLEVATALRR